MILSQAFLLNRLIWRIRKFDFLFVRKPDEAAAEDKTKDIEDNKKDDKEPKENKDEAEVEFIHFIITDYQ